MTRGARGGAPWQVSGGDRDRKRRGRDGHNDSGRNRAIRRHAEGVGREAPGPTAEDDAGRDADQQRDHGDRDGLVGHRRVHLATRETQGLQQRELRAGAVRS